MELFWIILTVGFAVSATCLAIALYMTERKYDNLLNQRSKEAFELVIKRDAPRKRLTKLILVSDKTAPTVYRRIEKAEADGYEYDKINSFPEVLCFTKWVEMEDETPAES